MAREILKPQYLGDGVYVHDQGHQLALAVNNHENIVIYMGANEINALIEYAKRAFMVIEDIRYDEDDDYI